MIYLAIVVAAAVYLGRGPSLVAAIAGVLAFDYFLVPPYLTFAIADTQYILTFAGTPGSQPGGQRAHRPGARTGRGGHTTRDAGHGPLQSGARPYFGHRPGGHLTRSSSRTWVRHLDARRPSSCLRAMRSAPWPPALAISPMKTSWPSQSGPTNMTNPRAGARTLCRRLRCVVCL